jgi:hypothetical protein
MRAKPFHGNAAPEPAGHDQQTPFKGHALNGDYCRNLAEDAIALLPAPSSLRLLIAIETELAVINWALDVHKGCFYR